MEQFREKRKRKIAARKEVIAFAHRKANPTLLSDALQISKLKFMPIQRVKDNEELDFTTGAVTVEPRSKKKMKKAPGMVK